MSSACSTYNQSNRNPAAVQLSDTVEFCSEEFTSITADNSSQKQYFENLLKRGTKAPIKDFLKLWYPERGKGNEIEPYFFHCQSEPWGPLKGGGDDKLTPSCKPDTLYSWGPLEKLNSLKNAMPNGETWSGPPNPARHILYTSLTPASTYAYGLIQVRFKIRPEVEFDTSFFGGKNKKEVQVHTLTYQEFNIFDSSVIESFSYGTPEQYDETVRDILKLASGDRAQAYYSRAPRGWGMRRLYGSFLADGLTVSEEVLKSNLLEMIRMILNGEGRIHYVKEACQSRGRFFSTDRPTYFNPVSR